MRLRPVCCALLLTVLAAAIAPAASADAASASLPPLASTSPAEVERHLDAATQAALSIQQRIDDLEAQDVAIDQRIAVTTGRIQAQLARVDASEAAYRQAEAAFDERIVAIYERGPIDPFTILLSSQSISELFARASLLTRITEQDDAVVSDLALAAADARYQAAALDDLRAQDVQLRADQRQRIAALQSSLAQQKKLIAGLTARSRALVVAAQRRSQAAKQRWAQSSIPAGSSIGFGTAVVHPYASSYVRAAYMPGVYNATGRRFSAVCSWYGNEFDGRPTSSGRIFNENDLTCASKTLPFGTVLALTRGDRRVIVVVDDRGPFVAGRDLDLSRAAASVLGYSGVATVQAEVVVPAR